MFYWHKRFFGRFDTLTHGRHRHVYGLTNSQRDQWASHYSYADREALGKANPIDSLTDRRQQARACTVRAILDIDTPADASNHTLKRLVRVTHKGKFRLLAQRNVCQLSFFKISRNPERSRVDQSH